MNWEKMAFGVCDYATPQIGSASVARSRKEKLYFNLQPPYNYPFQQ